MKLSIAIISCPRCGRVLAAKDFDDMALHEAKCPGCKLEIEVIYNEFGNLEEVKPKTIN